MYGAIQVSPQLNFINTDLHLNELQIIYKTNNPPLSYISSTTVLPLIYAEFHLIHSLLHIRHIELNFINIELHHSDDLTHNWSTCQSTAVSYISSTELPLIHVLHLVHSVRNIMHSELIFINTELHLSGELTHNSHVHVNPPRWAASHLQLSNLSSTLSFISSTLCYISGTLR